jgi:hypothetical protein
MRIRIQLITLKRFRMRNRIQDTQMMYLRNSRVKEASQTRLRRRLAARLLPTRTHRAQGEGGMGRGRGTDTPRAKSVTNTIYRQKFAIFIANVRRITADQPMRTYWNSTQVGTR